jgi:transcriptional regulatory protein LevR
MANKSTRDKKSSLEEIKTEFRERFEMLEESNQISPLARQLTGYVLSEISDTLIVKFNEKNAASFVTHLSLALTRIDRGEPGVEYSEVVEEAIVEFVNERIILQRLMNECSKVLGRIIPDSEISYMAVHLCAIATKDTRV